MKNVNDLGYGTCPACKGWRELKRYHPKDHKLKRREKNKYCTPCIQAVSDSRVPFYRIKKAIANHKTAAKEGDYTFKDLMLLHKQQGCMCAYCGIGIPYEFSLDHIIPRKFEGRNLLANIILTCNSCNSAKQHFEPFYFLRRKKYLLTERIIKRIKGAYDSHDYQCDAACRDCKGNTKPESNRLCKDCPINPGRYKAALGKRPTKAA